MPCIEASTSVKRRTRIFPRGQIMPRTLFYFCFQLLLLPSVSPIAEPKGFTEDPYVDDEKFREKGQINLSAIIITIIFIFVFIWQIIVSAVLFFTIKSS